MAITDTILPDTYNPATATKQESQALYHAWNQVGTERLRLSWRDLGREVCQDRIAYLSELVDVALLLRDSVSLPMSCRCRANAAIRQGALERAIGQVERYMARKFD